VSDSRGRLFYEIARIAEHRKPRILLLENVKNILTIDNGNVIKTIEAELKSIGYELHKHILNASFFGIPQARERVYFVGIRKNCKKSVQYSKPEETFKPVYLEKIMEKNVDKEFFIDRIDTKMLKNPGEVEKELKPIRIGIVNKGGQGERIYSPKGHAITLSAYGGGVGAKTGLYHTEGGIRRLTVLECKRAMGFPSKHYVSEGVQGYQQLGNAVVPGMIEHVWKNINDKR
jgi:DNA (cytosine-5)-methyltransferase 1